MKPRPGDAFLLPVTQLCACWWTCSNGTSGLSWKKIIFQEWENTAGVETVAMALSAPFLLQHLQRAQDLGTQHPSLGREGFVLPLAASNKAAKQ